MTATLTRRVLLALCLLISLLTFSQQKNPNTFLWRISGKGLKQPSYLYGTMHLQDKRLFQFGDSVYQAIEHTEGVATELDFHDLFDTLINNSVREVEKDLMLSKQKLKIDRSKLSPSADSLLRKFGIKGNTVSKKELKTIRDYRMKKYMSDAEMPTFMDGFLMGLALRQDKWTGGIEDVTDQTSLMDEIGGDLEPESVLQPEHDFQRSIERMISIYLAQDLDKIEQISNSYSQEEKEAVLTHRNVKMAFRMDSLTNVRPTFFAVGVAHLPGDSGVIRLLRDRGFTVEPVFSKSKTPADEYASHLKKMEWKEVKGDENSYTVQMPGKPSNVALFGEIVKMKMFLDFTSSTFYMVGSTNGYDVKTRPLDLTLQEMIKNMSGKNLPVNAKLVMNGNLQGKEAFISNAVSSYRIQVYVKDKTFFMLMAGSPRKAQVTSADADRFFSSFVPGNTVFKADWKEFSLANKGFRVQMPGTPVHNTTIDNNLPENSSWQFTSYQAVDPEKGFFYLTQVRQLKEGFFLNGDSAFFALLKKDYENITDKITKTEITTYEGYPAMYLNYFVKKVQGEYRTLHVVRGNRVYVLTGGAPKGSDSSDILFFLNSFKTLPYQPSTWNMAGIDGFTSEVPAAFKKLKNDSTSTEKQFAARYSAYNPVDAISYEVYKDVFSPTYWSESDSSFFEAKLAQYRHDGDSVLRKQWVQNGSIKGLDFAIQSPGYSTVSRVRLLVNRDTLFTLFAMVPSQNWEMSEHEKFFSAFRLQNEVQPTIYTSKAAQLLQNLTAKDSLQAADALKNLDLVSFAKSDLPLLHKSLLEVYEDSDGYYSTLNKLRTVILPLADSTTVGFIAKEYPQLTKEKEVIKYHLLSLLAHLKTAESYATLKKLLATPLPTAGHSSQLQYALQDSLQLTATLLPELLQKADDSLLAPVAIAVANRLLDSSLITAATLLSYEQKLLSSAKNDYAAFKSKRNGGWELVQSAILLGHLNTTASNSLLREFLQEKDVYLKQETILALLRNGLPVPAAEVAKVAADKSQRGELYEALQKLKKENLFPAMYATQLSLTESQVYNLFTEDYGDDFTLTYIGQRITEYEGKKSLFYLFKVQIAYDDEKKKDYLAIAGPYTPGAKEKLTYAKATGYYTDETWQPQKTDKLLKAYLLSLQPAEK
jgi:uncharacterized protein YbaP (TraB family)